MSETFWKTAPTWGVGGGQEPWARTLVGHLSVLGFRAHLHLDEPKAGLQGRGGLGWPLPA